jgi:LmbE family N-acetylglucosaminyl deacetylase
VDSVLLIHAHPDDESFANSGRVAQLTAEGFTVVAIVATAGEAGELAETPDLEQARCRRVEKYERALEILGVSSWEWLEPDAEWVDAPGGPLVSQADPARLQAAVRRRLEVHDPRIVLTVGTDGLTGHPDHVAIGHAVRAAARGSIIPGGVWGARLAASDVQAGLGLASAAASNRQVGSGRVIGTPTALTSFDVADVESMRRHALDAYMDGLGAGELNELIGTADRIGDSLLLRAVYDAQGWVTERYERIDAAL